MKKSDGLYYIGTLKKHQFAWKWFCVLVINN